MKKFFAIVAPGLVLFIAVLSGGWFLQTGVSQDRNLYFQARLFEEVVDHVMNSFVDPVEREDVYQSAIEGLLANLGDPNTSFMPATDASNFRIRMEGEYAGVGLEVIRRDGWVTVVTPLPGTPGTRAGVRAGDQIVGVDGQSTDGQPTNEVVDLMRGRAGTDVELQVRRPGIDDPISFNITRAVIELLSVPFAMELEDGVGYVPLLSVSETSFVEVRNAVDSLRAEGITSLILDLRGNPGGTLDQGIAISDYFLDPGQMVVETRGRASNQNETFSSVRNQLHSDLLVVVLVNERSASASEIIAGAIQDHDRGVVIGSPTYGKGSVQTLFPLTGGNILRLTTARWYTPVGRSISKAREEQIASMERSALTLNGFRATLPDTTAKPVYRTDSRRPVLGGGGIVPDVLVMADTLTDREQTAVRELDRSGGSFLNSVFNFSVRYLQENPDLSEDFSLTAGDLASFKELLEESDVILTAGAYRNLERFIRYQLEREIGLRAWGEAGEFRQMLDHDLAIERALALLGEVETTATLLEAATRADFSDWVPVLAEDLPEPEVDGQTSGQ